MPPQGGRYAAGRLVGQGLPASRVDAVGEAEDVRLSVHGPGVDVAQAAALQRGGDGPPVHRSTGLRQDELHEIVHVAARHQVQPRAGGAILERGDDGVLAHGAQGPTVFGDPRRC